MDYKQKFMTCGFKKDLTCNIFKLTTKIYE